MRTARLELRPFTPHDLLALLESERAFEARSGLPLAAGLRAFFLSDDVSPAWLAQLRAAGDAPDPWTFGFAAVHVERAAVIGTASFKGPPDAAGSVEVAYGIAPGFQGQGYATEATRALVAWAYARDGVRLVCAHTRTDGEASKRVLARCGFTYVGDVVDPEDGLVSRFERAEPVLALLRRERAKLVAQLERVPAARRAEGPAVDRWSAIEVAEHVARIDSGVAKLIAVRATQPLSATPEELAAAHLTQEKIDWVRVRRERVEAPERVRPAGTLAPGDVLAHLAEKRVALEAAYLGADPAVLDGATSAHPFLGPLTLRDWIEFIAHHDARHAQQLAELADGWTASTPST